ncbi:MAG: response regulator transcription factor [Clostridiaceae bacterium]|nr:response regulator transcription factor [Clostridiaceae bacterium]
MAKILIADDNVEITKILSDYARKERYDVLVAHNGEEALRIFAAESPDLVLLDVMMPLLDGFSVGREIRKTSMVPIIFITARSEDYERIMGLDIGGDDYILKPFSAAEVMARIRAIFRRTLPTSSEKADSSVRWSNLTVIPERNMAIIDDREIALTGKEVEILYLMASNPGKVYTREMLLDQVWGYEYFGDSRTVDSHIKRLRQKLAEADPPWGIVTVRGRGYMLSLDKDS